MASEADKSRLDDAARAGWLYYIAGNTQDEIARKLNVSRPTAQRLVSLCLSERLITFRLEHPIGACMELAARLTERFGLRHCEVVPTDSGATRPTVGIAECAAGFLERTLRAETPAIVALGTGRTLRAAVDQVQPMRCPLHQLVSLIGNISRDGSASFFDVLSKLADLTQARHYPMPLPVIAASPAERERLLSLDAVRRVRALAERADMTLVGVGQMDQNAQLYVDGFISQDELFELMRAGAIGEVAGWAFDRDGRVIEGGTNLKIMSVPHQVPAAKLVVGVAMGAAKLQPIHGALRGAILNGLITDEKTAADLLAL